MTLSTTAPRAGGGAFAGSTSSEERQRAGEQTILALVENRAGILNRITGLLRRRHFDLLSLSMGRCEVENLCRLTLTVRGDALYARRVASNLAKLVEVVQVETLEERPAVRRDLALVKVMPKATELPEINALCGVFRAHIVDVSPESVIVEITGDETKIGRFCSMLRPYGVVELARSECVAMRRGESVHAAARTVSEREVLDRP